MTRQEVERKLDEMFREMIDFYHQYNPDGNYLDLTYINDEGDNYRCISNHGNLDDSPECDREHEINFTEWEGKGNAEELAS